MITPCLSASVVPPEAPKDNNTAREPSRRPRHRRTANAILSLLDAAWSCRARGDRVNMRALSLDAKVLNKFWNPRGQVQGELL
jgi:hypothetical protein